MALDTLMGHLHRAQVPVSVIEKMMGMAAHAQLKSQTRLVAHDSVCDKIYYVLKGAFVCRYIDESLEVEKTINFFMADFQPFMTCIDSYFSETRTQCELLAVTPSEVLMLGKRDMEALVAECSALSAFYHSFVITALRDENDFKMKVIAYPSERLYQHLITHCPAVIQQIPSRYIAEFMGISPEWLSKLKHRI